jgi:hypothetical protein
MTDRFPAAPSFVVWWLGAHSFAAALFLLGEVWAFHNPTARYTIDETLLDAQLHRSWSGRPVSYLFTGDSSGLVGVDAPLLSELLGGEPLESLATMGSVGPAGWAEMARRFVESGGEVRTLIFLIHPGPLGNQGTARRYEMAALTGRWPAGNFGTNFTKAVQQLASDLLRIEFNAKWGPEPLTGYEIRRRIEEGRGTLVDPLFADSGELRW